MPNSKHSSFLFRFCLFISTFLLSSFLSNAEILGADSIFKAKPCHLKISILTCGTGNELYSAYGHSAIRVIDSCAQTDVVYNYGTFDFGDPDFYMKFTRGKLNYYLDSGPFEGFMGTYVREGRSVHEQITDINPADAQAIQAFLIENEKPENKSYKYDFLFDNCSTRIRDLFDSLFHADFRYGKVITDDSVSFRTILDYYERNIHWERFGINLLLSHRVDDLMTKNQAMFIPDYLEQGFANATLRGKPFIIETKILLPNSINSNEKLNQPRILFWIFLVALFGISRIPTLNKKLIYFDVLYFMILGLLGCFMLFMWLGTEHAVCAWNRNLLWAFPLHIGFAFWLPRQVDKSSKYAKYAKYLLVTAVIYGLVAFQKYGVELTPILILTYWRLSIYSKSFKTFSFNQFKTFR